MFSLERRPVRALPCNFTHNVAFEGYEPMKLSPGGTATRTFDTAGTFPYRCTLHPLDMQSSVEVTAS